MPRPAPRVAPATTAIFPESGFIVFFEAGLKTGSYVRGGRLQAVVSQAHLKMCLYEMCLYKSVPRKTTSATEK